MTPVEKLVWDLKVTAGARFNAAHRLAAKDKRSNVLLAVYSALLIGVSVISIAFELPSIASKALNVGGLISSVILLVMSMKLFSERMAVDAEQMHRCALEINELKRSISALEVRDQTARLSEFTERYNALLQKYSINHSEQDYEKYKFSHRWEFNDLRDLDDRQVSRLRSSRLRDFKDVLAKSLVAVGGAAIASLLGLIFSLLAGT